MTITIHVDGTGPEEIVRGLIGAPEVFNKAGVTPHQTATARFVVEDWDIKGFSDPAPEVELDLRRMG